MKEEAIKYYTKAITLNPFHVDALFNIGVVYQEAKETSKSLHYFLKAIEVDPFFEEAVEQVKLLNAEFQNPNRARNRNILK